MHSRNKLIDRYDAAKTAYLAAFRAFSNSPPEALESLGERCDKAKARMVELGRQLGGPTFQGRPRAFTLIEIMVVLVIVVIVSAIALPVVLHAMSHRQVSEAARILQAALAGARDSALRTGAPSGIRLLPDPAFPLVYLPSGQLDTAQPLAASRIVPIEPAPEYSEGALNVVVPSAALAILPYPALMVEADLVYLDPMGRQLLNAPASWFWNVRVGDKLQINGAGRWYTVVGPMVAGPAQGNSELYVNVGPPSTPSPWASIQAGLAVNPEYLFLVNGTDDNDNGWIDEGFDGVDNNANGLVDELAEWEAEAWGAAPIAANQSYRIQRRPAPAQNGRDTALPPNVVIDLTTWSTTRERSRLAVSPTTGYVDLLVYPTGAVVPQTVYSTPAAVGMDAAFLHFWLAERNDVVASAAPASLPAPAGQWWLVSVSARTGRVSSSDAPTGANPFLAAQQGGGQ